MLVGIANWVPTGQQFSSSSLVPRPPRPAFVTCSTKSGGRVRVLGVEAWERGYSSSTSIYFRHFFLCNMPTVLDTCCYPAMSASIPPVQVLAKPKESSSSSSSASSSSSSDSDEGKCHGDLCRQNVNELWVCGLFGL